MKNLLIGLCSLYSLSSYAAVTCADLQKVEEFQTVREENVLNKQNWKQVDVINNFDYQLCKEAVGQDIIEVNGEQFRMFKTNRDNCDGGNSYGSIYSMDMSTVIGHIYDGDVYCESNWSPEYLSANHKCDLAAEDFAVKKMAEFGLTLESTSSDLTIRDTYVYSFINVSGKIANRDNRDVNLQVMVRRENCHFGGVSITGIQL